MKPNHRISPRASMAVGTIGFCHWITNLEFFNDSFQDLAFQFLLAKAGTLVPMLWWACFRGIIGRLMTLLPIQRGCPFPLFTPPIKTSL